MTKSTTENPLLQWKSGGRVKSNCSKKSKLLQGYSYSRCALKEGQRTFWRETKNSSKEIFGDIFHNFLWDQTWNFQYIMSFLTSEVKILNDHMTSKNLFSSIKQSFLRSNFVTHNWNLGFRTKMYRMIIVLLEGTIVFKNCPCPSVGTNVWRSLYGIYSMSQVGRREERAVLLRRVPTGHRLLPVQEGEVHRRKVLWTTRQAQKRWVFPFWSKRGRGGGGRLGDVGG